MLGELNMLSRPSEALGARVGLMLGELNMLSRPSEALGARVGLMLGELNMLSRPDATLDFVSEAFSEDFSDPLGIRARLTGDTADSIAGGARCEEF
jgi:hypothetical protein